MKASGGLVCQGVIDGENGKNGYNAVAVPLYRRSSSELNDSNRPSGTLTYTFSTGKLTGPSSYFNGWSQNIPTASANTKLYVIMAVARSQSDTDDIAASDWSTPVEYVADGMNSAPVFIYKRAESVSDKPANGAVYTFATGVLAGTLNGWSTNIPATDDNHYPCWVRQAMAVSRDTTDVINASEWSDATKLVEDGAPGKPGGNTATIFLYRRSNAAITTIGTTLPTLYYKFSTKRLYTDSACTTLFTGQGYWYQDIPSGSAKIYVTTAVAYSTTDVDAIGGNEWVSPVQFTENGSQGAHGINTASIFLYKRSSGNITTHGINTKLYYKFADGKLYNNSEATTEATQANLNYWSRSVPADDGTPCYIIQASALSNSDTDDIAISDWSTPVRYVKDGEKGDAAVMYDIVFSEAWAKVSENGIITARLKGIAYKITGSNHVPQAGVTIRYGYILNDSGTYVHTTALSDGSFDTGSWFNGDRIEGAAKNSQNIFAAIIINNTIMCTKYVTIANQGDKGDTGRMYYIAGEFPQKAPYYRTDKLCPVVYYETEWWYLDAASATASDVPSDSSTKWKKIANFGVVITDAIFVKQFAQFGAAIITGDWLISVWGKIYDENDVMTDVDSGSVTEPFYYPSESSTPAYTYFNPNHPNSSAPNVVNFVPNYAVDLKTGKSYQNDCFINGFIRKKKTIITTSNISQYKRDDIAGATVLDFDKCGSFIELSTGTYGYLTLPLMSAYLASRYTSKQIDDIRSFVGTTMLIYNKSGRDIPMTLKYNSDGSMTSGTLRNGNCVELECCLKADDNDGKEIIYWKVIDYAEPVN